MAIKGLTDRQTLKPRLPRLGKLRKGAEKTNPKKPGVDLDHFRFTSDNAKVQSAFYAAYGEEPRVINTVLFYDTAEENFDTWIEAWDASGMVFRSDGENWLIWREGSNYKRGLKPHIDSEDQFEVGRLEIVIPELLGAGFVGTVTLETHSNHDLRNIASVLYAAEQERGKLRGAQFSLRRVEEEISVPGWGDRKDKRSKAKKWLVKLEASRVMFDDLLTSGAEPLQIEAPELSEVKETTFDDLPPAPRRTSKPETKPEAPKPTPTNKPKWPASGPVANFCADVRKATDHYTSSYHISNAIGGFGNLSDPEVYAAKLSEAIDRVNIHSQQDIAAQTPAIFGEVAINDYE